MQSDAGLKTSPCSGISSYGSPCKTRSVGMPVPLTVKVSRFTWLVFWCVEVRTVYIEDTLLLRCKTVILSRVFWYDSDSLFTSTDVLFKSTCCERWIRLEVGNL